jgi:hypothetical protein
MLLANLSSNGTEAQQAGKEHLLLILTADTSRHGQDVVGELIDMALKEAECRETSHFGIP